MTRCLLVRSLVVVIGFALQCCTFEPDNQYINPLSPPEPLTVSIEVNDRNFTDPFYIIEPTTFTFTLTDLTKPVIDYVVAVDGDTLAGGYDEDIKFFLFPHSLEEGTHTVTLSIRVATQSGSLAEKLGAEYYLIEKSFQLINDRTVPPAVTPTAAYEDGRLTIRWNTINQKNFYYVIKRAYAPYNPLQDSIIRNTAQNVFIDDGFVGGEVTYAIAATGFGFERRDLGTITFKDDPVDFQVSEGEGKTVKLNWNNSRVNVQNTQLYIEMAGRTISVPMTSSGNLLLDTLVLGQEQNYWIKTSKPGYGRQAYTRMRGIKLPQQIKAYTSQAMLVDKNRLLLQTETAIYRYRLPSFELEDSLLYQNNEKFSGFVVSEDGNRAVLTTEHHYLYEFNPMDFDAPLSQLGVFMATAPYTGGTAEINNIVLGNLSQNGLLTMVISKHGSTQIVYDINNNVVPWYAPPFIYLNAVHPPVVSNDGRYLANDYPASQKGEVYEWNGSAFDQIGRIRPGRKYFRPANNEIISGTIKDPYQPLPGAVLIYDLATLPADPTQTLPLLRSKEFPDIDHDAYFWETGYDHNTDVFYVRYMENATSILTMYNANTMGLVDKVSAFTYAPYTHQFEGNYHLTNRGYIEQVK